MAAKIEWQSFDYATHTVLAQIIDDSGKLTGMAISHKVNREVEAWARRCLGLPQH